MEDLPGVNSWSLVHTDWRVMVGQKLPVMFSPADPAHLDYMLCLHFVWLSAYLDTAYLSEQKQTKTNAELKLKKRQSLTKFN